MIEYLILYSQCNKLLGFYLPNTLCIFWQIQNYFPQKEKISHFPVKQRSHIQTLFYVISRTILKEKEYVKQFKKGDQKGPEKVFNLETSKLGTRQSNQPEKQY